MYVLNDYKINNELEAIKDISYKKITENVYINDLLMAYSWDDELYLHSYNVAQLSFVIGYLYGIDENTLAEIYIGAMLHDVGKLGLDKKILYKSGRLTAREKMYVQEHPEWGYRVLKARGVKGIPLDIVRYHHEKLDGTGYPSKLFNENISAPVRIVTVADMFEAMTADRCYRKKIDQQIVIELLNSNNGVDKEIVEILKDALGYIENITAEEMLSAVN